MWNLKKVTQKKNKEILTNFQKKTQQKMNEKTLVVKSDEKHFASQLRRSIIRHVAVWRHRKPRHTSKSFSHWKKRSRSRKSILQLFFSYTFCEFCYLWWLEKLTELHLKNPRLKTYELKGLCNSAQCSCCKSCWLTTDVNRQEFMFYWMTVRRPTRDLNKLINNYHYWYTK
jgi:hypothetical protein